MPPLRPTRFVVLALLGTVLTQPACWNDSLNQQTVASGGRFQLTVEPSRTDIEGTHLLVDSATGDMWRLEPRGETAEWVRLATGPEDAAEIEPVWAPEAEPTED